MKYVTIKFPVEEAVEMLRSLRGESRCLIENGDVTPDFDVIKRAQLVLSARERIVSELEVIADVEQEPLPLPDNAMDLTAPGRPSSPFIDDALRNATTRPEDGGVTMGTIGGTPCATITANSMEEANEIISRLSGGISRKHTQHLSPEEQCDEWLTRHIDDGRDILQRN